MSIMITFTTLDLRIIEGHSAGYRQERRTRAALLYGTARLAAVVRSAVPQCGR